MTSALDQSIRELLNASADDEQTLQLAVADRIFGLHAQQAIEKLQKALIAGHDIRPARIHDLAQLNVTLQGLGEIAPSRRIQSSSG